MFNCIGNEGAIFNQTEKLDNQACLGLLGAHDSISYRLAEIEKHLHNVEKWFGKLAVQTATNWADRTSLIPFRAISGLGVYGADLNDEAQVLGSADTPVDIGMVRYDCYRVYVYELSSDTPWRLRMVYGSGTMAEAIAAGQYTELMFANIVTGSKSGGTPVDFRIKRQLCGIDKIWMQAQNATDNATADFFIGLHEYEG